METLSHTSLSYNNTVDSNLDKIVGFSTGSIFVLSPYC